MKKEILFLLFFSFSWLFVYPANVSSLPYGINVHQADNEVLQKVVDAGIKWIRTGANWSAVESRKGLFDWTQLDRVVNYAQGHNLSILFVIAYTPGWANDYKGIAYPPDKVGDWEHFVRVTVTRYKDRVKYWNIWNEPNARDFFAQGKDVFVEKIFLPAAQVIRDTDPSAFIVGPELAHLTSLDSEWYFWMKYILIQAGDYIDIVSHHIYKNEGVDYIYELLELGDTLIPPVREIIRDSGYESKPFWITETGWNTATFSEEVQADRYLAMLQKRREKGYPNKIFFYEIIDDPSPGIAPWGILRSDRGEKPAYGVYKDFIAGKYPDDGGGGDNGDHGNQDAKQCFSQHAAAAAPPAERSKILANLRVFRDTMRYFLPAAQELTRAYYNLNGEFLGLALADSRVFRLGVDLVHGFQQWIENHKQGRSRGLPEERLISKTARLIALLKTKKTSQPFRNLVRWAESQLELLKKGELAKLRQ
jgi:hypothetical protein